MSGEPFYLIMRKQELQWEQDGDIFCTLCGKYVIGPETYYPSGQPETYMVEYFANGVGYRLPGVCYTVAAAKKSANYHFSK